MRLKLLVRLFIVSGFLAVSGVAYSRTGAGIGMEMVRRISAGGIPVQTVVPDTQEEADREGECMIISAEISARERLVCQEPALDEYDRYLLASLAMAEAEGEDVEGKALVIRVVLNRVKDSRFPDTVEEVVYQKNQFTPVSDGRLGNRDPDEGCWTALNMVLTEGWDDSRGALYFERESTSQWHRNNLKYLFRHGNHTFYTEKEE